jgi:hypothetical protein
MAGTDTNAGSKGPVVFFKDIVEKNGKTVYENRMAVQHKYKLGDRVKYTAWEGSDIPTGIYFIVNLGRDCDGEVLYSIAKKNDPELYKDFTDKYRKVLFSLALNKDKALDYIDMQMSQNDCERMFNAIEVFTNTSHHGIAESSLEYALDE